MVNKKVIEFLRLVILHFCTIKCLKNSFDLLLLHLLSFPGEKKRGPNCIHIIRPHKLND